MRSRMTLVAALGAVVALTAAGCGGGSQAGAGSSLGGAASIAPADSVALVAVDTDLGSGQWQAVNGLRAKFPAHDALVTQIRQAFEKSTKLSWANDVKPALGAELDVVVLPAAAGGKAETVVLVQPSDQAKLDALVAKLSATGGTKILSQSIGGWTALSASQAALDAVAGATSHLAADGVYQEATGKLAGDALVRAYANGAEAKQLLGALGKTAPAGAKGTVVWGSADVVAASGGLKVDGYIRTQGATATEAPYSSALVDKIPAGALFVADFQAHADGAAPAATPGTGSSLPSQLQSLLAPLAKVGSSLGGETALYVSPGLPIPSVTLVTHAADPQATVAALDQALAGLGSAVSGSSSGSGAGGLDLGSILSAVHLSHEVVGGDLVVSTSPQAIADFKSAGQKLAGDGTFTEAQSASAMPSETTGFLYANLKDAVPSVQALAGLAGLKLPAPLSGDLSALRTLTAYGTDAADTSSFTVFLEVS